MKGLYLGDDGSVLTSVSSGITLTDRVSVPSRRSITDAGQMIVPCAFARTGIQIYSAKSLGLVDKKEDELVEVVRSEKEVFAEDSMESFRSAPVTIGHPKDDDGKQIKVTADNAKDLQVGMLEGMPVRDEDLVTGTLVITNQDAIDKIDDGTTELSAGYTCDVYEEAGVYYQTNIKANHIAIVDKGRAGSNCAIADEELKEEVPKETIKDSTKEKVVTTLTGDVITEAEAADRVAAHEENETLMQEDTLEWAKQYALDAEVMANAHREVAKLARKLANKKAKETTDSEEELKVDMLEDVTSIIVALDVADETIGKLGKTIKDLEDSIDAKVVERCDVILIAKNLVDELPDIVGKSVNDIKKLVVDEVLDIDLDDKSSAYIEARFDILVEDSNKETPMSKLLKKEAGKVTTDKATNLVLDARNKMIDNMKNKGK